MFFCNNLDEIARRKKSVFITKIILSFISLFFICSCQTNDAETLYENSAAPRAIENNNPNLRASPNYYQPAYNPNNTPAQPYQPQPPQYQQAAPTYNYQQQNYQGQNYQAQPYQHSYQQAQPQYYQPQTYQQNPGSRYYSNPYDIPPAPQQYPRYDADQYYVPPIYNRDVQRSNQVGSDFKN